MENRKFAVPDCQFFEVHGSKFKPHTACNSGQTSVVCITHGVFFFRVRKDTLNRLFTSCVNILPYVCFSDLLHQIQIFLPNVSLQNFLPLRIYSALLAAGTLSAYFGCASVDPFSILVCCGMAQCLSMRAGKGICCRIIDVIPRAVSDFFRFCEYREEQGFWYHPESFLQSKVSYMRNPW